MNNPFLIALVAVAILLLEAAPGFFFVKRGMIAADRGADFSKVLLYFCQPCLAVYTFTSAEFSMEKLADIGIFAAATLAINVLMLGAGALILRKKFKDTSYRIITVATVFANCAFFGIPIIEALLPDVAPELIIYTIVYATVMNILGWAIGIAIITGDAKNISAKKIFINPAMLGVAIALPLFIFSVELPGPLSDAISVAGRMTTPLSMLIMGMRLATASARSIFTSVKAYAAVAVKAFLMPLIAFGMVYFLPIPTEVKQTFFIIAACPTASVVLNFSELCGAGQREAAASVLLSTIFSVVTLPIMVLMLPLF